MQQRWPERLWVVRHGESAGNVARDAAHAAGLSRIEIGSRDVDVPLSALGERQSFALGQWFASQPENARPDVVMTSPYLRAQSTGMLIRKAGGFALAQDQAFVVDERLREKEFGILDRLTRAGIKELHPEQVEFRRLLGKFYYRPPDTMSLHHGGRRVLILTHQVVVLCMRYLLESLTEDAILAIDRQGDVANCAVTEYRFEPGLGPHGGLALERYNFVTPLEEAGAPVTSEPDLNVAAR
jgi:2,3-bisphosphoglycerate-dependent phosphoglycerate mutase